MKKLFLDIETLPADMNDPVTGKALKFLFERKLEKKTRRKEMSENVLIETDSKTKNGDIQFEDYVRGTSFDGSFGKVLCICLAVNDDPVKTYCTPDDEKKMIENFWKVAAQADLFVGHNVMDFDLRFIWQRSVVLGIKPTWQDSNNKKPKYLSFRRFCSAPIYDTMHEWTKWGRDSIGLEHLALSLGLPTPKEGIDGFRVWEFYKAGKIKEIADYCARDVETTRAVYKRMVFQ
jgi:predicted PolB exonuclease-like 3'-5' exonuclease